MRIVFVNLHANEMLVRTFPKKVFKQSVAIKHKYILDYLIKSEKYEVCTYINERGFDLFHHGYKLLLDTANLFRFMESDLVLKSNGIDLSKVTVLKRIEDFRGDDIVIMYRHHPDQLYSIDRIHSFKVISYIHFWGKRSEAKALSEAHINCQMNECNLTKTSTIYNRFYGALKNVPWVIHPFVFEPRFEVKVSFNLRRNKAVAVGTITYKNDPDFLEVYGDPCDQPSRKQIKDDPLFFSDTIDCYSSDYIEDSELKVVTKGDNRIQSFYKKLYNRTHSGQQKKYYSFNMVDAFNSYKMCIVGEEILGVPGIGFVEGMACGCAYIGIDSPMYTDVGLIPGVHYITYDGSKEDLKRVIEYYQMDEHQAELEKIAKTGCEYVRTHFNGDAVAEKLLYDLEEQQKVWLTER